MQIRSYDSARDFLDRAQSYLAQEESVNGLMLGIAIRLEMEFDVDLEQEKPYLLVAEQDGALMGTAVMTPPHKFDRLQPSRSLSPRVYDCFRQPICIKALRYRCPVC